MPQAMVLSGRKWPLSRKVAAPRTVAAAPDSTKASSNPIHGDPPCTAVYQAVA